MSIIGVIGGASGAALTEQVKKRSYQCALVAGKNGELGTDLADYVCTTDLRHISTIKLFFRDLGVENIIIGTGHRYAFDLAEQLEQDGFRLNINIQASLTAKDKILYKDLIASKGFLTPAYIKARDRESLPPLNEIVEKIGFPAVVKASIDTMYPQKAQNTEELEQAVEAVFGSGSPVLIEQYVKGIDVTVPVSVANGSAKAFGVCYYSKAEECDLKGFTRDEFLKETLSANDEQKVLRYCEKLALASGFEGLPRVDAMVRHGGDTYVLEVNSVGVTGPTEHYAPFTKAVLMKLMEQNIDLADVTVTAALKKFGLPETNCQEAK